MAYRSDIEQAIGRAIAKGDFHAALRRLAELASLVGPDDAKPVLKAARRLMTWLEDEEAGAAP